MNAVGKVTATRMKSLDDVKLDMSELYEQVKAGTVELKVASELANISGKYLKAAQLELATEIFMNGKPKALPSA